MFLCNNSPLSRTTPATPPPGAPAPDVGAVIAEARRILEFFGPPDPQLRVAHTLDGLLGGIGGTAVTILARQAYSWDSGLMLRLRSVGLWPVSDGLRVGVSPARGWQGGSRPDLGAAWIPALLAIPGAKRGKGAVRPGSRNDRFVLIPWSAFPPESPITESLAESAT